VAGFAAGPVALVVTHPEYEAWTELTDVTRAALAEDLEGRTTALSLG
jgi:hypothetical protein